MEIFIPDKSGFCPGVKNAEIRILQMRRENPGQEIQVLGNLIHNKNYIRFLAQNNIVTIEEENQINDDSLVCIRTHGIDKNMEAKLRQKYELLDLTCYKVKHLQNQIESYAKQNYAVLITGKKNHPEVISLKSYADKFYIVEKESEINDFIKELKSEKVTAFENYTKILIVSQTTGNRNLFDKCCGMINECKVRFSEIKMIDSICSITSLRENEAVSLQKKTDITFVIGDKMSSNANKLFLILKKNNDNTYFIENFPDLKNLKIDLKNYQSALVVSSSSTPDFIEKQVVNYLNTL